MNMLIINCKTWVLFAKTPFMPKLYEIQRKYYKISWGLSLEKKVTSYNRHKDYTLF